MSDIVTESPRPARDRRPRRAGRFGGLAKWQLVSLVAGASLAVLLVLTVVVDAAASVGRVHPGVRVGDVAVGGLTSDAAKAKLQRELPARVAQPVVLSYGSQSWTVRAEDLGVTFDYEKAVAGAMEVGRTGRLASRIGQRAKAWFGRQRLSAAPVADEAKSAAFIGGIDSEVNVSAKDASVSISKLQVSVEPSEKGRRVDDAALEPLLLEAFTASKRTVNVPVLDAAPRISDAAAQDTKKVVEQMISAPATVVFGSQKWDFGREDISSWISLVAVESTASATASVDASAGSSASDGATQEASTWVLEARVSAAEASRTIAPKLGDKLGKPAVDATFKTTSGTVVIVPSQTGLGPDIELLAEDLTRDLADASSDRKVELRTRKLEPALTTDAARAMGIKQRISTFTTTYDSSNKPRVTNIHLLGDALNGKLVAPGDTFSFNGYIGERTAEKGYKEANAIVNGKLVPQLGGGICQVGTTLFNAIFESGFPVVERHNHSFYISHYPKGRDATVSWGGPDLKFKNDSPNWVLVSVSYTAGSITISLYGTDPGYTVTSQTGAFTDAKPFPIEEVPDPTLFVGVKVIDDKGVQGGKVVVTRTVSKNGQVIRTDTFTSVYNPKSQVVRVGTKPKASTPATTTP